MGVEEFLHVFGYGLLPALIFIAFVLVFLYLVYCEGETTSKTQKENP
ncbi:MAG: hypothetical protein QXR45_12930 [Candidatus Bathyarchaeia archaeon]